MATSSTTWIDFSMNVVCVFMCAYSSNSLSVFLCLVQMCQIFNCEKWKIKLLLCLIVQNFNFFVSHKSRTQKKRFVFYSKIRKRFSNWSWPRCFVLQICYSAIPGKGLFSVSQIFARMCFRTYPCSDSFEDRVEWRDSYVRCIDLFLFEFDRQLCGWKDHLSLQTVKQLGISRDMLMILKKRKTWSPSL